MRNWSKYLLGTIVVISGFIGTILIAPNFHVSGDIGALIGIFLGFLFSLLIPNLWKSLIKITNDENRRISEENRYINFWDYITHPTLIYVVIGTLWLVGFIAFISIFQIKPTPEQSLFGLLPLAFFFGLSGLMMVKRKEFVKGSIFGYLVVRSDWAIFWGTLTMLIGWGGGLVLLLATMFKW